MTWHAEGPEGPPGPPGASGIYSTQIEVREQAEAPDPTTMQPGEEFYAQTDYSAGDLVLACNPGDQVVNFHGARWSSSRQWDFPDGEVSSEVYTEPTEPGEFFSPAMNEAGDGVIAMTGYELSNAIVWRLSVSKRVSRSDTSARSGESWFTATLTCAPM